MHSVIRWHILYYCTLLYLIMKNIFAKLNYSYKFLFLLTFYFDIFHAVVSGNFPKSYAADVSVLPSIVM